MPDLYVQRDQPPGVPPLSLTGERTLPDVPEENYWFRRHLVVYEWIAARAHGRRVVDLASGEGYGSAVLARTAASVVGVEANPEAFEHARAKYGEVRFERNMLELWTGDVDCVVFLQTIEHVQDPDAVMAHVRDLIGPARRGLRVDAERPHAGAAGRRQVRQPVARARVPGRRVPGAVRAALRVGRPARASSTRAGCGCTSGRSSTRAGTPCMPAWALTRPFYDRFTPGHLHPRLRPAPQPARPRAGLPRGPAGVRGQASGYFRRSSVRGGAYSARFATHENLAESLPPLVAGSGGTSWSHRLPGRIAAVRAA